MTLDQGFLDLIEHYREKFGEAPPVMWYEYSDEDLKSAADEINQALSTGKPWVRQEFADPLPKGVRL